MKKQLILTLMGVALLATSCEEEYWMNGEQYDTVMNYKQSGDIIFDYYTVNADVTQTITIGKGGYNTTTTPTVTLVPYTQEELDAYNTSTGQSYKLIPADQYTLPQSVSFTANDMYKKVDFVLKGTFTDIAKKNDSYILPIKLQSNIGMVNQDKDLIYLKPTIQVPSLRTDASELQTCLIASNAPNRDIKFTYNWELDIENHWEFKLNFETTQNELQKLVDSYNTSYQANYQLIPASNYTIPSSLAFASGESRKSSTIVINGKELQDGDYLLPVKIKSIENVAFDISSLTTKYIHIHVFQGSAEFKELQLGTDFAGNTDATIWACNQLSYQSVNYLFDNITNNSDDCWHSQWYKEANNTQNIHDEKYGIYLDINLKNPLAKEFQFKYWTRATENNAVPSWLQVYGGASADDLQLIKEFKRVEDNLPTSAQAQYTSPKLSVEEKPVNFIRIAILESYDGNANKVKGDLRKSDNIGNQCVAMGEFELYGN